LESRGIELWRQGQFEAGAKLIEEAIAADSGNPRRPLNYGGLLMTRGQVELEQGDAAAAARTFSESERQLAKAVRIGEGLAGKRALTGQGFFLLGEIAFFARQDTERAAKFYQSAAKRLPEDSRIRKALKRVGVDASAGADAKPASRIAIGMARSIVMAGQQLRLSADEDNERVSVQEFVPPGETVENWSTLFARREHRRFISPKDYASFLSEEVAKQGGRVVSAASGPGDAASLAFVLHLPGAELSEVNVWNFSVSTDGKLVSRQYARRVRGIDHETRAEHLANRESAGWLLELREQRRPVSLVKTSAVDDDEDGE